MPASSESRMPSAERTSEARVWPSPASLASSVASILSRSWLVKVLPGGECIGCSRMPEVAVVTDSTAYLPPELVERYGLEIVPLYIVFGGDRTVHETEITDYPAF